MKRILKGLFGLIIVAIIGLGIWGYAPDRDPAELRAKYTTPASQFVDVGGGLSVHVRDEGKRDGPVLVLLHGSNASLHTWEPWVARLGSTYRIISLDQIGHGMTGPNPTRQYNAAAFVGILDAVMTKLNIPKFALAGNSMGGWVSWNYALAYPDKLTALILLDASGAPDAKPKAIPIGFRLAQSPIVRPVMTVFTPRSIIEASLKQTIVDEKLVTDAMVDRYWDMLRYPGNRQATGDRGGVRNRVLATPETMAKITMPTLILWGDRDSLIPVSAGRWFDTHIPNSTLIVYKNIGHIPMEETPDQSAVDVARFLQSALAAPPKS
jgi:pimeloyl-ACP methyl ester carboxylesterase